MKKSFVLLLTAALLLSCFVGCGKEEVPATQAPTTAATTEVTTVAATEAPTQPTTEPIDPTEGVDPENIYYVGPEREHKSLTQLFLDLKDNYLPKTIFLDEGTYDIFREYKDAGIPSPPDDVESPDYFDYNAFLPINTRLIGVGNVRLEFNPGPFEITYGESRTWSPLNVLGECYIENLEIFCKNGRYCIHDDSHNDFQDSTHYYKNVRCTYQMSDYGANGQRLGFNNTIGNGMAQGTTFLFEDCTFVFKGGDKNSAFYTHESGSSDPWHAPTLTFRRCVFQGGAGNARTVRLQNLASANLYIPTLFEDCTIEGGLYLTIYSDNSAQHYDVTLIRSGNPSVMVDKPEQNYYPVKVVE